MAPTLIANMLVIATEDKSGTAPMEYMGVEFSQPISMDGAAITTLTGTVQDLTHTTERCDAEIQGSDDQMWWFPVAITKLPDAPGPFALSNVAVNHAWVRVRWQITAVESTIGENTCWQVSAELNTHVG